MLKGLVLLGALLYALHRWVPRVQITTPMVILIVGTIVAVRTATWVID